MYEYPVAGFAVTIRAWIPVSIAGLAVTMRRASGDHSADDKCSSVTGTATTMPPDADALELSP
jgi:hypothetical protein